MNTNQENCQDQTSLNDQISDSIGAMESLIKDNSNQNISLITYQIMAHAAGLAMLNAVNQQQQFYTLQNAMISVAAKEALESKSEESFKIINEAMKNYNLLETFTGLKNFMDDLTKTYEDLKKRTPDKKPGPPKKNPNQGVKT